MNQNSDEQLMLEFQAGSNAACTLLYERYKHVLMSYFYNNTKSRNKSEDLLQTTFEKVIKNGAKFQVNRNFKAWIFTIARNCFIDSYNKERKLNESNLEDSIHSLTSEKKPQENGKLSQLQKAISDLRQDKRELITLVKIQGYQYKDAAEILETTEANIKIKVFRILKELKKNLAVGNEI